MFNNLFSKQEPTKDEYEFRRVDGDRVYPAFWRLGDDFYFKPNTPLSISFSYFEFLDYLIRNYSEFINKDIVYLFTHNKLLLNKMCITTYIFYKTCTNKSSFYVQNILLFTYMPA